MIKRMVGSQFSPSLPPLTPQLGRALVEFHISAKSRDYYEFDQGLFAQSGNVIFTDFRAARLFAQKMNAGRDLVNFPEQGIKAGQLNAMGLIDEILHLVVERYREMHNPEVMALALNRLNDQLGKREVDDSLLSFIKEFPPLSVYRQELSPEDYLEGESVRRLETQDVRIVVSNREIALEEMLLLWLANSNPAFNPFQELFDHTRLERNSAYRQIISELHDFFDTQAPFGPDHQNLVDMLRSPAVTVPHSLSGQLKYIHSRWGYLIGKYLYRLLSSLDFIKEEERAIFGVGGASPARVYDFTGQDYLSESERFSPDLDWMPNLVLMAKNVYVWLDQLSKKYQRAITRLDQIPEEELEVLASWGITGLWLIGLWERSNASQTIKQILGNPEAVASAYSLFSYDIAADLGGEEAYQVLRRHAWQKGVRLASDMVPNHMGIDSRWVIDHPDWFISLDYSPFPSYSFNGPNLSSDNRVGIYIEDHYYNNTDAAVVFKRTDLWTGRDKYIYHGNDGTSMPWNDTAQLNYLLSEVREAVIQTILHVARKFPIIRFDAAMTLAKRHYQRLWFPEPGSGGDIPSRSEHGMSKAQFDRAFPEEFWRQVVDRVAQEVPDTLLLAEAFWLMEGYFVRTLGMHRVYNSAFMNMLRDEKNQEYRLVIKNTLEFDPEILKRYVNFMNNPDERTAVDQFGKGDKYFGICTMMATLPGLPMFGHGQVEGYTEKYGMEFKHAYWAEQPDTYLVERHKREIFPLLRRRSLFAEARNFLLYDFYTADGHVNEDVFAYSNQSGDQRALVVYHNKYSSARGWIRISAAYPIKKGLGEEKILVQKSLGEGLGLQDDEAFYAIFRDHVSGLEYIRSSKELRQQGMYVELEAYKYHVFTDFREIRDDDQNHYAQLSAYLNGSGVPDIEDALKELLLQPLHVPFRELVNPGMFEWLIQNRLNSKTFKYTTYTQAIQEAVSKYRSLLVEIKNMTTSKEDIQALSMETQWELEALLSLPGLGRNISSPAPGTLEGLEESLQFLLNGTGSHSSLETGDPIVWGTFLGCLFTYKLGKVSITTGYAEQSHTWIDEWLLGKEIARSLEGLGLSEDDARQHVNLIRVLISNQDWYKEIDKLSDLQESFVYHVLEAWLQDPEVQHFVRLHRYQDRLWYKKESFEEFLWCIFVLAVIQICSEDISSGRRQTGYLLEPVRSDEAAPPSGEDVIEENLLTPEQLERIVSCYEVIRTILEAEEPSGYQVEKLLQIARQS